MNPALLLPVGQRFGCSHLEEIQARVVFFRAQFGTEKPLSRKLCGAIGHVLASEHPHGQHLRRCKLWRELTGEVLSGCAYQLVTVALLHTVINGNGFNHVPATKLRCARSLPVVECFGDLLDAGGNILADQAHTRLPETVKTAGCDTSSQKYRNGYITDKAR